MQKCLNNFYLIVLEIVVLKIEKTVLFNFFKVKYGLTILTFNSKDEQLREHYFNLKFRILRRLDIFIYLLNY